MISLVLFFFGLFIGSFLLVLVDRLPREESVVKGRSHCDYCGHVLAPIDLIPVISFLSTDGKCRYCKKKLSLYYPIVELLTGVLFASISFLIIPYTIYEIPYTLTLFYFLFVFSCFIVIFFTDIKYGIIPDVITFPAIIVSSLYFLSISPTQLPSHILAGLGAFIVFYLLNTLTKGRGMGFGDVKLVLWLGILVGFPSILLVLYMSFVLGAIVAVLLILARKKHFKGSTVPFGPFLVISTYIVLFYGPQMLHTIKGYVGI